MLLAAVLLLQVVCLGLLAYMVFASPVVGLHSKLQRIEDIVVGLDSKSSRGEQVVRDELRSLRTDSGNGAQQLRDECSKSSRELREEVVSGLTSLGERLVQDLTRFRDDSLGSVLALNEKVTAQIDTFSKASMVEQVSLRGVVTNQGALQREAMQESSRVLQRELSEGLNKIQVQHSESSIQLVETTTKNWTQLGSDLRNTSAVLTDEVRTRLDGMTRQVVTLSESNETRQEGLRKTVEERLDKLNENNGAKLEEMRQTVDEKLHSTLEKRLTDCFGLVTDQLGRVQVGLGEMKDLATGVGDLKRVLTNVKVRGGFAEVQLGMQLEQVLSPAQFTANAKVNPNSQETVEYAIRLPNGESGELLLPIDAKFPREDWERLEDAQQRGDIEAVGKAGKSLEAAIRAEAKKISEKYINPPVTTPLAIMFLPTEGLFSEVIRRPGLVDELQSKYQVSVAGPTTFGAILASLQMVFRTFAIQKKGVEVWRILAETKVEFGRFGVLMGKVESQVQRVQHTLTEIGTRTKAINRKLKDVDTLRLLPTTSANPGDVQPLENNLELLSISASEDPESLEETHI
jgi:DNA recombination protein RmuC